MNGTEIKAAISKYVLNCSDCCGEGLDHMKGTGSAAANHMIESIMIILSASFFFGTTLYSGGGSINFVSIII
jgi:hypothetical protein